MYTCSSKWTTFQRNSTTQIGMGENDMASQTHTERALVVLRQRILSGAMAGGERLFEVALAEELKISRTPVRAALSKLSEEGLLERVSGGGFSVRRFQLEDVLDTIELRGVLEGTAARLAAERGAPDALMAKAEAALENIDRAIATDIVDMTIYSSANSDFHKLISAMAASPVIEREIARVTALPFAAPSAFLNDDAHAARFRQTLIVAQDQHRSILSAIAGRESGRAEFLMREHARAALRNVRFLTNDSTAMREGVAPLALVSGR